MGSPLIWAGNAAKFLKSILTIPGTTSGNVSIAAPATITDYTITLPSAQGTNGDTLVNNGSGTLSWAAGGGGSSVLSIPSLSEFQNKLSLEQQNLFSDQFSQALGLSNAIAPLAQSYPAIPSNPYTAGATTLYLSWVPVAVNDSDQNMDSTTGWTATGQAASLATSGTGAKFGTNKFTFNKGGSGVEAGLRYDRGSQTLSLAANTKAFYWLEMPSVTNFTNAGIRIYADSTSNYRTWTVTTDVSGAAITTGWNLIAIDISTGGTATGTGWTNAINSRYQEIFVTATSGQTYTAIAVDALHFSLDGSVLGFNGNELEIFDSTNRESLLLSSGNTLFQGPLTITAALASSYTAGFGGSTRAIVRRSGTVSATNYSAFDTTVTAGAASTTAITHIGRVIPLALTSNTVKAFVDSSTPAAFPVASLTGTTLALTDPANLSTEMSTGDTLDVFRPTYQEGTVTYTYIQSNALTSTSSASAGVTTVTMTSTTGIAVGDMVVKRAVTSVSASAVSSGSNESYSTLTLDAGADGLQLINNALAYPNAQYVYGHYKLGGLNSADGLAKRYGTNVIGNMSVTGTLNFSNAFKYGQFAVSGFTDANYLSLGTTAGQTTDLSPEGNINLNAQFSFWFYPTVNSGGLKQILGKGADVASWNLFYSNNSSGRCLQFGSNSAVKTPVYDLPSLGQWYHIYIVVKDGDFSASSIYVNGTLVATVTTQIGSSSGGIFQVGRDPSSTGRFLSEALIADMVMWVNAPVLTQTQIAQIYNAGNGVALGSAPMERMVFTAASQTGNKLGMKATLARRVTTTVPVINKMGLIRS